MKTPKIECEFCDSEYDGATDGDREHIIFCSVHANAHEMLATLREIADAESLVEVRELMSEPDGDFLGSTLARVKSVIEKAMKDLSRK